MSPKERTAQGQSESSSGQESDDEQEKDEDDFTDSDEYSEDDVQEAQEMIQHPSFYPQPRSKVGSGSWSYGCEDFSILNEQKLILLDPHKNTKFLSVLVVPDRHLHSGASSKTGA